MERRGFFGAITAFLAVCCGWKAKPQVVFCEELKRELPIIASHGKPLKAFAVWNGQKAYYEIIMIECPVQT